jgi:hypothetical protein
MPPADMFGVHFFSPPPKKKNNLKLHLWINDKSMNVNTYTEFPLKGPNEWSSNH